MLNILIVDDEYRDRRGMSNIINNQDLVSDKCDFNHPWRKTPGYTTRGRASLSI